MTNRIAIWLGLIFILFFALNYVFELEAHIYLGRKFLELVRNLAFWR